MALNFGKLNFSVSFNPTAAFPIDARSYFESYADAIAAAATAVPAGSSESVYYYGQTLVVVENNKASFYIIQPDKTLSGIEGASGNNSITVNPNHFVFDAEGNLSLKGFDTAALGSVLSVGPSGTLVWSSVYTKAETDAKIGEAVSAAAHLKRVVVESVDDIDPTADNADHYIYMVPTQKEGANNKYDEYMVLILQDSDGIETRIVEQVGKWDIDLSGYVTQTEFVELQTLVNTKVTNVEGYRLMSDAEGEKLAGLKNSPIETVDTEVFNISESKHLTLKDLPISKITNLDNILNHGASTTGGYFLVTQTDKDKLNALVIGNNGLEISGTVNASNVKELDAWITNHASIVPGLSENNLTDELLEKLNNAITEEYISSTDDNFTVENGKLNLKDLPVTKITNLQSLLDAKANQDEFTTLVGRVATNEADIQALMGFLTWGELTE